MHIGFFLYNGEICPSSPHTQFYVYREREEPLPVPTCPSPMRYRPRKLPHSQLESTSFSNGKGHCAVVTQTVLQEQGVPSHSAMFCAKAFFTLLHKVLGSIWLQKQQYKTVHNGNQNTNRRKTNTRGCTGLYGEVQVQQTQTLSKWEGCCCTGALGNAQQNYIHGVCVLYVGTCCTCATLVNHDIHMYVTSSDYTYPSI